MKTSNLTIKTTFCKTIFHLFFKLKNKKKLALQRSLKKCIFSYCFIIPMWRNSVIFTNNYTNFVSFIRRYLTKIMPISILLFQSGYNKVKINECILSLFLGSSYTPFLVLFTNWVVWPVSIIPNVN